MEAIPSQYAFSFSSSIRKPGVYWMACPQRVKINGKLEVFARGMLAPRKFMQRRWKRVVFKDPADERKQRRWRGMMTEIEKQGCAVEVLRAQMYKEQKLSRDFVLGTLMKFKQLKEWRIVAQILEWLRTQYWWDFNEMDFLLLITAYGKIGNFKQANQVLNYMNKKGFLPSVISHTALMEAYGKAGHCSEAEAIFQEMKSAGPEPSPLTYQIMLKTFVEANKFVEAEAVFQTLLNEERASFKPDQQMFHMMIYMYRKAGNYDKARKLFAQMIERGIPLCTVTFNSLMSFETSCKGVLRIYEQMQSSGFKPDVVSYTLLISAFGKARREDEALSVFEEMLDARVRPTSKAYNVLLDAFAISGMLEEAKTVFKCMRRDKVGRDICSYATMLSAYVNASDMDGAEKFFRRLKGDGFEPNVVVYGTLMKGYAKENNIERMMGAYERMRMEGIEANQTIYTTIMDAYGTNVDFGNAVVWFKEMEASGFPPDQKAKNILFSIAKTPEEKMEANKLVVNGVSEPFEQITEGKTNEVDDAHFMEKNTIGEYKYDDDDDDDDDGVEEFVSFRKREDLLSKQLLEFESDD